MVWILSSSNSSLSSPTDAMGQNIGLICSGSGSSGAIGLTNSLNITRAAILGAMGPTIVTAYVGRSSSTAHTISFSGNNTNMTTFPSGNVGIYTVVPESWHGQWREVRTERQLLEMKRDIARRGAAEAKAEVLLRSCLSEKQESDLSELGHFDVPIRSEDGDRVYRVKRGYAGNVYLLGADGREAQRFCAHPTGVPPADSMLAQKLMLEANEPRFLKIANRMPVRRR